MIPMSQCSNKEARGQEIICLEACGWSFWDLNLFQSDSKRSSFAGHVPVVGVAGWWGCRILDLAAGSGMLRLFSAWVLGSWK